MIRYRRLLAALALCASTPQAFADSASVPISATILSRALCTFSSNNALNINFGNINPADNNTKTQTTTTSFRCIGWGWNLYYTLTAGNGNNALAPGVRRMNNTAAPGNYLPYSLDVTPATGAVTLFAWQNVTVTGSVAPGDYKNARVGPYSDTVVLTLNP